MRRFVVNIVASYLAAGHSATIMTSGFDGIHVAKRRICDALEELGVLLEPMDRNCLRLKNGAFVQFGQLTEYMGNAYLHTPVVVLVDVKNANQTLVPEARAIPCVFPDGRPSILIEC